MGFFCCLFCFFFVLQNKEGKREGPLDRLVVNAFAAAAPLMMILLMGEEEGYGITKPTTPERPTTRDQIVFSSPTLVHTTSSWRGVVTIDDR